MHEAYIVAYGRSAIGKGNAKGAYAHSRPDDVAAEVLKGVIARVEGNFDAKYIEDVIVGCSFPEAIQGINFARTIALRAGLPHSVAGQTVNRFCSSGLQTIATAANAIMSGQADCMVAGGVEFMSAVPMGGAEPTVNPTLQSEDIGASYPMGLTAENVAEKYHVSREDQDAFGALSHQKAHHAQTTGRFEKEIVPVEIEQVKYTAHGPEVYKEVFKTDQGIRPESTPESLGKLRTVFKADGSVTAATSSQISDGAAFVILMSKEMVEKLQVKPIARFVGFKAVGVDPKVMGIGPAYAIPEVLEVSQLKLEDIDLIELNEAFAAQALASARELNMNMDIVNVNGGAIALGHPLGATGAILTSRLLAEMSKRPETRYGMVSMCIGVGMGAAGIFEYVGDR
ncbi:thiolase family protein [Streptococcus uberis]|uniref:thiolase family protein n=1 Tax=Streptococcus uberis TaxID=1349 RepID=UPI000E00C6B7|nr:thiolase family protein [Streptococcus uberis]MCZ8466250.1 thiolase family protein [Streptococcus uberis]SUO89994.1 acetyl-CoA C-acyltransferase FadA [Streptococcus uberis]